jgi:hypothetical protein
MKWKCCDCGIENDFSYKCVECGTLNSFDFICTECGALNDVEAACSCGHELCDNCKTDEETYEPELLETDEGIFLEEAY